MSQWNWKAKREKAAFLALEDGTVFHGYSAGAPRDTLGETVFNTGMAGYQEILSDPSYAGQIVTMTYPEIGNIGMNGWDMESRQLFANGFVIHDINLPSNWRSESALQARLADSGIPCLAGIDTRALTLKLRKTGTLKAYLSTAGTVSVEEAVAKAKAWEGLDGQDYASRVSCTAPWSWDPDDRLSSSWGLGGALPLADLDIVTFDYGVKWNILRNLRRSGMNVRVVPAKTTAAEVLNMKPDGVFLSNGPADPAAVHYAVDAVKALLGKVPIMGICLGHQLLGLACGGTTRRLKFGHHGCNHPVMDLQTRKVEITSQNHNFCVDEESLNPETVDVTHRNLNDGTVEGLRHLRVPAFSVQYHPEAAPGPHDPAYLFARFRELIAKG